MFARQMQFLADNGYRTLSINDALRDINLRRSDARRVVITFDDGYSTFLEHALPTLRRFSFEATVFVVTGFTGEERVSRQNKGYMTWNELRMIQANGMTIGSHTVTHPTLRSISLSQIEDEIRRSKQVLEAHLNTRVSSFSYPTAFPEHNKELISGMKDRLTDCGYDNAVSSIIGTLSPSNDRFLVPRIPINSYDDLHLFQAKLHGAYDWLHAAQYVRKMMER
jgi:peptidoglycan/xylan/chitin deacetylase (PgdA/CDA1 family)